MRGFLLGFILGAFLPRGTFGFILRWMWRLFLLFCVASLVVAAVNN